nr:hypothetical protein CFP56_57559 [Quercus suber]
MALLACRGSQDAKGPKWFSSQCTKSTRGLRRRPGWVVRLTSGRPRARSGARRYGDYGQDDPLGFWQGGGWASVVAPHPDLASGNKTLALIQARAEIPASFDADLAIAITRLFHLQASTLTVERISELDKLGSSLWNNAVTLPRHEDGRQASAVGQIEPARLVVLIRVLAYLLVDTAHHCCSSRRKATDHQARIFRVALKACRTCLDHNELSLAYDILQRLAQLVGRLGTMSSVNQLPEHGDGTLQQVLGNMSAEYQLLRMAHAWKSDRSDLVDHFYTQLDSTYLKRSANLTEKAAELFYHVAKSMFDRGFSHDAMKWSERSLEIMNACDIADMGPDAPDLRLATTSTLVDSLVSINDPECRSKAGLFVEQLDSIHGLGNRVAMHLLRFNFLIIDPATNAQLIEKTVFRMIGMTLLTEKSFKLCVYNGILVQSLADKSRLLQILHKARRLRMPCAVSALDDLIVKRLMPDLDCTSNLDHPSWIQLEKAVVTYVMFVTSEPNESTIETTSSLRRLLDAVQQRCKMALSQNATHAAQTLMWKAVGSSAELDVADDWCSLLRHPIFDNAGQTNKARIWRWVHHH